MKKLLLILTGVAVVGLLLFGSAFLVPKEAHKDGQPIYTDRPLIAEIPYEPPKVNARTDVPFCDGARAVVWNSEDVFANLDEGWEGYFRAEAGREGKNYSERRAWTLLRRSVFPHPCNYNHWRQGAFAPINEETVSKVGYFYWPDVIVQ
ncbi:MAG: hypothetical protein ABIH88_01405 [Patescibacteria group bacterium]|nr:hypothetical protein [Patescibacteria group bacterium]